MASRAKKLKTGVTIDEIFKDRINSVITEDSNTHELKEVTFYTLNPRLSTSCYKIITLREPKDRTEPLINEDLLIKYNQKKEDLRTAARYLRINDTYSAWVETGFPEDRNLFATYIIKGFARGMEDSTGKNAFYLLAKSAVKCAGLHAVEIYNVGGASSHDVHAFPVTVKSKDYLTSGSAESMPPSSQEKGHSVSTTSAHSPKKSHMYIEQEKSYNVTPDIVVKQTVDSMITFYMCIDIKSSNRIQDTDVNQLLKKCIAVMPFQQEIFGLIVSKYDAELYHVMKDEETDCIMMKRTCIYNFQHGRRFDGEALVDMFSDMVEAFKTISDLPENAEKLNIQGHYTSGR